MEWEYEECGQSVSIHLNWHACVYPIGPPIFQKGWKWTAFRDVHDNEHGLRSIAGVEESESRAQMEAEQWITRLSKGQK